MSPRQSLLLAKLYVAAAWMVALAGFFLPEDSSLGQILRLVLLGLAVVHALECAIFFKTLRRTERPLSGELLRTFLFGVVHYLEVKIELEAQQDPSERSRG